MARDITKMHVDEKYFVGFSLAYLDERLVIREIHNLVPFSEENVCSKSQNIRYALEVNKGWFDERDIKIFSKLSISD